MLTARHLMTASFALVVALTSPLAAEPKKFDFALIGDQPYFPKAGTQQLYPAQSEYINIINTKKSDVEFTVHVGDIKAGDTFCSDDVYSDNLALFDTFANPLIYLAITSGLIAIAQTMVASTLWSACNFCGEFITQRIKASERRN
jgi:hypothetical protein